MAISKIKNKKSKTGFTLIELVVALGVTVIGLMLFAVVVSTIPLTRTSRNQNLAYHIAAKKIEELRNTPFASMPASGTFSDPGLSDLNGSTAALTVSDYQSSADIKEVRVSVSWLQEDDQKSIELETLIYDGGVSQD